MKKVRVGILGCGGFAGNHAKRLAGMNDAQVVGLCDVSEEVTRGFQERNMPGYAHKVEHYTDPADLFGKAKPDAVVIVTPHTMHYRHASQALKAGCHVFVEKPMVTAVADAYALAEEVRAAGKILTVGYNTSCTPAFNYLREKIRAKAFGRLELINAYISQNWLKATAGKWRQDPALSGGGQAYDSGAHLINSLVWSVESPVSEVFAFIDNHGSAVDINSAIAIKFESGVLASLAIGGNCLKNGRHMAFMFENGLVEIDGWGGSWIKVQAEGEPETPEFGQVDGSPLRNFIDAVLGNAEPKTSPLNGIHQSELMEAIYDSASAGRPSRPRRRAKAA